MDRIAASLLRRAGPLLAALAALLLAGCTATRHQRGPDDSRLPPELAALPACSEAPLRPGGRCVALVRADAWWSDTGVHACVGQAYRITVPAGQRWFDLNRVNEPPFGEPGNALMNLFARWKRHRSIEWFSLIAAVTGPPQPGAPDGTLQWVDIGGMASTQSRGGAFVAKASGRLVLYPNDAIGPETHRTYFYENNSGQVWVGVEWVRGAADPATCGLAP